MRIKQATTAVMNAITAAVIAILNVNIRFRPLVRRSSVAKKSRSKSRRRILIAEPSMTSPERESQPHMVSLALEPRDFDQLTRIGDLVGFAADFSDHAYEQHCLWM